MTDCKSCGNQINGNYCANCGLPAKLKRIDKHYISHEVLHLLHFEKGFFYTIRELMTRPGDSIREFIVDNRNKHVKPVGFLILTSLLYTLIAHYFHADEIYNDKEKLEMGSPTISVIMRWVQTHYGYANVISSLLYTLAVKLFFRKYAYNFFEITVLICFVLGQTMLLFSVEAVFVGLMSRKVFAGILTFITFAYFTWSVGQFFDKSKIMNYVKAFFAYLMGYILFILSIFVIGFAVDFIVKHS
jgi:hypothetical protein